MNRTKQYLLQIRAKEKRIERIIILLTQIQTEVERTTSRFDSEHVSGNSGIRDRLAELVARKADVETDLLRQMQELISQKARVTKQIHSLEDLREEAVLFKRYVEGKSLYKTATEMSYSYDRIRHIHGQALRHFGETILKEEQWKRQN